MVGLIFGNSQLIAERLIELISETNKGITFHYANSYEAGIPLLKEQQPAVVLLELNFAGNNIIDLIKKIKALDDKTIVIVLFSVQDEQKLAQCKANGADYILDMYNEFEKFPKIINRIVNSKDNNQ